MAEKFASNIILTKIWTDFSNFSNPFSTFFFCFLFIPVVWASAQSPEEIPSTSLTQEQLKAKYFSPRSYDVDRSSRFMKPDSTQETGEQESETYPNPKGVLIKSLIIPGWGQLVNKQAWKIPLVYGLIGGVVGYNIYLTKQYHDYRAAFYNATHNDMKFGPTPDYIPEDASDEALRNTRNQLRNRRDLTYLAIVLAYGLNALDAYVFAHMRSFDVSEDLSLKADVKPALLVDSSPGVTLSVKLFNRNK